ncbi:ABC transporter permease [Umboniibacter marinipuniceus]|uniref:ABC-type lipoprotein release transport system permease subunit n=1 Tax=Umboniibacter marinipuniceus TaxID=569599 RepID=A0A3M0A0T6_9GAMM|nr:FtsX-like permease family protein [Umboniibacter marinipuniceus]RMA78741.1 ABC-type lipoprotein release transport system permease subunit [Umboniibacter marinipuniceus]
MNTEFALAWRNLWRRAKRTWITIAAIVFCNAILVFGISVQMGAYDGMIDTTLKVFGGHIQLSKVGYNDDPSLRETIPNGRNLAQSLRNNYPKLLVTTRSESFVLAATETRSAGVQIVGVEPSSESEFSSVGSVLAEDNLAIASDEAVLGSLLSRHLGVSKGDEFSFVGTAKDGSFAAGMLNSKARFESGSDELDRAMVLIHIEDFDRAFAMAGDVHQIMVQVPHLDDANVYRDRIEGWLANSDIEVLSWQQLNPGLQEAIQADLTSAMVMYGILIALVIFSVLNTQLMSVLERTHEFGIMKSIGLSNWRLAKLIFIETAMLAAIGLIFGVLLGAALASVLAYTGLAIPGMDEANYSFQIPDRLYPLINFNTLLIGPTVVFFGSLLAAIYPARKLQRLQPIEAMRS